MVLDYPCHFKIHLHGSQMMISKIFVIVFLFIISLFHIMHFEVAAYILCWKFHSFFINIFFNEFILLVDSVISECPIFRIVYFNFTINWFSLAFYKITFVIMFYVSYIMIYSFLYCEVFCSYNVVLVVSSSKWGLNI